MSFLALIFAIYLIYVSYFKIVCVLFRGKQYNKIFATVLNTLVPVLGSIPALIMASKYERRIFSPASRMNEDILRHIIVALQMLTVLILFLPFFSSNGVYSDGANLIFGNSIAGSDTLKPAVFMIYLIVFPFVSAVINIVDRKLNIHNIVSYSVSLFLCLSILAIWLVVGTEGINSTPILWIYCALNVTIMLLSIFSLVIVRNRFLTDLEKKERIEYIDEQKKKNKRVEVDEPQIDTYRCAKCGSFVKKGTVCSCISTHKTLSRVMENSDIPKNSEKRICIYCKKVLEAGERCNCQGDGFALTVEPKPYQGRKCKYCGQLLVGESTCVCEKILKNSLPADNASAKQHFHSPESDYFANHDAINTSNEMDELEKKINQKFSKIKSTFVKKDYSNNADDDLK